MAMFVVKDRVIFPDTALVGRVSPSQRYRAYLITELLLFLCKDWEKFSSGMDFELL